MSLDQPIILVFNEAINSASVTAASVKVLAGSQELAYTHSLSSDGKTLTLTVTDHPSSSPAAIEVRLNGIKDLAGNAMTATSFTFTSADETAPTLLSHTPADGADGVLLASPIILTFSEPMDPASVTSLSLKLLDGSSQLAYSFTLDASETTLSLTLTGTPAALPATLDVELNGLTDKAGNPVATTSFSFTTAAEWAAMGGELDESSTAYSMHPSVAAAGGEIYVAFKENNTIYVKVWNSDLGSWELVGSAIAATNDNKYLDLALDSSGAPVLAYSDSNGISVYRWNGSDWEQLGSTISEGANPQYLDFAVGSNDDMAVIWWNYEAPQWQLFVASWDESSSSWGPLGGSYSVGVANYESGVAVDSSGNVYYAVNVAGGVAVMKWNGSAWGQLGPTINHGADNTKHKLAVGRNDELYYACVGGGQGHVDRWDESSSSWTNLGSSLSTVVGAASWPIDLKVDSTGRPLVLFFQDSGVKEVYAAAWNEASSSWDLFGEAVFGMSDNSTYYRGSIGYDANDLPIVSWWMEDASSHYHVYASRYNGLAK